MSALEIQRLSRENRKMEEQIREKNRKLSSLQNQLLIAQDNARKWQKEKQFLQQQIKQLRRKQEEAKYQRQATENRYFNVLSKLENELELRKRKYQHLQNKIQPLLDYDTVRLKILNEVQSVHFMQIEEEKRKNNHLKDQVLKLRRQNELLKFQMDNLKIDHDEQIRRIRMQLQDKDKNNHFNSTSYQMCLQIQNRLRINYEQAKKQLDYYKDKYFGSEKRHQQRITQLQKELTKFRNQSKEK